MLVYEFQACDNDPIDTISLEHNADIALRNEGQKWFTWFSKECRNLNRLSAQLIKMQSLLSDGQKVSKLLLFGIIFIIVNIFFSSLIRPLICLEVDRWMWKIGSMKYGNN